MAVASEAARKVRAKIRIHKLVDQMHLVELEVIADLCQRLYTGQLVHGNLADKFGKGHNWRQERREEEADSLVYLTAEMLDTGEIE